MSQKFDLPTWQSLQNSDTIRSNDFVEDLASGKREIVGQSQFYQFLTGQRAGQARYLPEVFDIVRRA
jgi:hypothetical protein